MVFTSYIFILFLAVVLLVHALLPKGGPEKWLLLIASWLFCVNASISCALVIIFTCVMDFTIGRKIGQSADRVRRKRLMLLSVTCNLGLLGVFKYSNFLINSVVGALNFAGANLPSVQLDLPLPPGISFFTFASISYVIDVYNKRLAPCEKILDYSLFVTFFPKLLSGPIVRAADFLPQLKKRTILTAVDIETAAAYFLSGAVKKLVISDQVAGHVNLIFSAPAQYDGFTLLQGLFGYVIQIYCDFSGYSDMAIGVARLFGFKFPENFQMPFSAASITDYWRRWHITMSNWFRDYVFFPLEMATRRNPNPAVRAAINVTGTMLLCGLWHGAGWNYIIWGAIHGIAMAIHLLWTAWKPLAAFKDSRSFERVWTLISHLLTLGVVLLAAVFFRTQSLGEAAYYLKRTISWAQDGTRMISPYILPALLVVVVVHLFTNKDSNWPQTIPRKSILFRTCCYTSLLLLVVALGATNAPTFIYFQF